MLVLRRRLHEAVVFDGGLSLSLASLEGRRAWLTAEGPGLDHPVTLTTYAETTDRGRLAVADPKDVRHGADGELQVSVAGTGGTGGEVPGPAVLVVERRPGERVRIGGLSMVLQAVDAGRPTWGIEAPTLAGSVALTVFSTSTVDARIGIEAPSEVRVFRQEVWLELQAANQRAASWTPEELASLAPRDRRAPG
jgi:carbon storage regulator